MFLYECFKIGDTEIALFSKLGISWDYTVIYIVRTFKEVYGCSLIALTSLNKRPKTSEHHFWIITSGYCSTTFAQSSKKKETKKGWSIDKKAILTYIWFQEPKNWPLFFIFPLPLDYDQMI